MKFPDFRSVRGCGCRPAQPFPVLPGMGQAGASSLPQNLPFELGEDGQQAGHRSTRGRGQVQRLCQRNEADAEMLQFLERCQQIRDGAAPAVQPPHQHHIDLAAAAASSSFSRASRLAAPEPTSRTCTAIVQPRRAAYSRMARTLHRAASAGRWWKRGRTGRRGTFSPVSVPGQKRYRILPLERPVWRPFRSVTQPWPQTILFGQAGIHHTSAPRQRLAVVPGHPLRGVGRQFLGVALQLGQIVERVGAA